MSEGGYQKESFTSRLFAGKELQGANVFTQILFMPSDLIKWMFCDYKDLRKDLDKYERCAFISEMVYLGIVVLLITGFGAHTVRKRRGNQRRLKR